MTFLTFISQVGWTWTRLLLSVNQTDARLWVNCAHYSKVRLAGHIDLQIPAGGLLYFRQEPGLKNKLIVSAEGVVSCKVVVICGLSKLLGC